MFIHNLRTKNTITYEKETITHNYEKKNEKEKEKE
jgi:hypothetical protein